MSKFVFAGVYNFESLLNTLEKHGYITSNINLFQTIFEHAEENYSLDFKRYATFVSTSILSKLVFGSYDESLKVALIVFYIISTNKFRRSFPAAASVISENIQYIVSHEISLDEAVNLIFKNYVSKVKKISQIKSEARTKKMVEEIREQFPGLLPEESKK